MYNVAKEAILEVINCSGKKILCLCSEHEYLLGLIKRGGQVYCLDEERSKIELLLNNDKLIKKITFLEKLKKDEVFDVTLSLWSQFKKSSSKITTAKHCILFDGCLDGLFWKSIKLSKYKKYKLLLVAPSLNNIKFIVPAESNIKLNRYWSLRSKNALNFLYESFEWLLIQNKMTRKIYSDKFLVLQC